MTEDKPKIVPINQKAQQEAEETKEAIQEAMAATLEQAMTMVYSGDVEHLVVITQSEALPPMLLAAGLTDRLQLYKMFHYLSTKAAGDYDYGISYIMGELEDDEE